MYGLRSIIERGRAQELANGGRVRGPGTGTSDSIKATVPEGSYIMPADSTAQVGLGFGLPKRPTKANPDDAPKLGLRRNGVPVNLSNGEHALSPEQVQDIGAKVLDAVRDATHVPAPKLGLRPFLADGGKVKAQERGFGLPGYKPPAPAKQNTDGSGFGLKRPPPQEQPKLGLPDYATVARWLSEKDENGANPICDLYARAKEAQEANAPKLGFGPTSVLARTKAERQSFADGGAVEDDPERRRFAGGFGQPATAPSASRTPSTEATSTQSAGGLPGWADRNVLPVTRNALDTAARDAEQRWQSGDYSGAIGRTVRGAAETVGSLPLDAYEYARRGVEAVAPAARGLTAGLAGAPSPAPATASKAVSASPAGTQPATSAPARGIAPFNAADLTDQQRNTAGDIYRESWQRQAPGGLRRAGGDATALYNAEQQVRGTGITARRGANGVMEFSGTDVTRSPAGAFTEGVDLNSANERMARANAIRGETTAIRDQINFNAGGGGLSRQKTNEEIVRDMLTGPSRSGRQVAAGLIRGQQEDAQAIARLGLDQERAAGEAETRGFQTQQQRNIAALQDRIVNPKSAADAALASRSLAAIQGKEPQNAQVIYNEELINPAQPMAGTRRVPMILNRDGTASVVTPRAAPKALPNGVSRDAAIQSARRALESGYNREAVLARLGEYGLSFEDIAR
ncbi:hypothetical protein [Pseudothauera rhizosphaerae]|uniref:Uncharacterized protein n=1 Tax=Pseudothauera rhizosphaerae TaxID=2565932 RepID=A0A4S4AW48_9RHOO|nr:hypothetical protein [Pseudothauera rhizosphaerae]THF64254.1 hypothetical protein E6O51_02745 [Pseudothauera rhizosphaerae]